MDVEDYALFTVMIVITGAMNLVTKGGVHFGFTAIIGRVWPDRNRAAQAMKAAIKERRLISLILVPAILAIAGWLLFKNHATYEQIALLLFLLLIQWEFDMRTRVVDQILLFAKLAPTIQTLDTFLSILRLIGIFLLKIYSVLQPVPVILINVLAAGLRVPFILRWLRLELPTDNIECCLNDRREIRRVSRRQLPLEVFFVFQSQVVLLILAWAGSPNQTAYVGALSRIGQLLLPVQAVTNAFAVPRFSAQRQNVFRNWLLWSIFGGAPGLVLVLVAYWYPAVLLFLIGPNYSELTYEVFIFSIGSAFSAAIANSWQLVANKGWNYWAWLQVPVFIAWCAIVPLYLDMKRLDHLLWFQAGFPIGLMVALIVELIAARLRGELLREPEK
ncbi:hypothetical protein [Methylomonas koyamae]|nr:hypothetical protein [Methylomonas koyamae]